MHSSVNELIRSAAEKYDQKTAYTDTEKKLSFKEVDLLSKRIAAAIAKHGLYKKPVFVLTRQNVDTPVVFLGIARAGCFYIPQDASGNPFRIRQILEMVQPEMLIASRSETALIAETGYTGEVLFTEELLCPGNPSADPAEEKTSLPECFDDMTLYVIFTSGSSGKPKGVETPVCSVLHYINAVNKVLELSPDHVLGCMSPMDYIAVIRDIYLPLLTGAMTVILPVSAYAMIRDLAALMEHYRISVLCWSAAAMEVCSRIGLFDELKETFVRKVLFSGSVLPGKVLKQWQDFFPDAVFINQYGPTEATASCTFYVVKEPADEHTVLPIGRPYTGYKILLLNETGAEAKPGETGEICVSGIGVARGYYMDPEQSAAAFIQNPLNQESREIIYKTGDLGRLDSEGILWFLGRKDRQVKYMGHRVEPEEIEQCAKGIPEVEECAVVYDSRRSKLCLFYTGSAEKKSVFLALRKKLPAYLVPGIIVAKEALPHLANGKTDYKSITEWLQKQM